ncbi:alpha/beta hydrolase [Agrobacterium sp. LAD9]|uniref:alpha/beta hydrolase n=1 Tax=Agrobacterium sp. LAD9 TaxID=2055153 RepID=UPI0018653E84|nr:alpha/beta fold hydrolase [Agrobacterium sp. LAD9]
MLVATTRQPSNSPALRYTGERGENVRLDNIVVSIPPASAREIGRVQWPDTQKPDPRRSFVTAKADLLNDSQIIPWFRKASHGKKRVLVFVHGFNNDYAESVFGFAQLVHDARIDAAPVLFTWPSRGNVLDYVYDRESTVYSRFGLGAVLKSAIDSPDVAEVTVLAHSMGTWLTMEALRDMANKEGRVSPKIRSVILASPDIDVDVFRRQVLEMGDKRPHITILSSQNDLALKLSTWLAGDVQRLGATDFRPYEKLLRQYGITVIDASDASQEDVLGHSAFAQNADILKALGNTFLTRPEAGRGMLLPVSALGNLTFAKITR